MSKDKVDLAKVLLHFENSELAMLNFASVNYQNSSIHLDSSNIGGGRFFSKQLNPIVTNATPDGYYYWFKKLYEFYQISTNKDVVLESAIQQVTKPHVQALETSFAKTQKLYFSKMMTMVPIVNKLLSLMSIFLKKSAHLTKQMPLELIFIAKKLGGDDIETPSNKSSDVYEAKTNGPSLK